MKLKIYYLKTSKKEYMFVGIFTLFVWGMGIWNLIKNGVSFLNMISLIVPILLSVVSYKIYKDSKVNPTSIINCEKYEIIEN